MNWKRKAKRLERELHEAMLAAAYWQAECGNQVEIICEMMREGHPVDAPITVYIP